MKKDFRIDCNGPNDLFVIDDQSYIPIKDKFGCTIVLVVADPDPEVFTLDRHTARIIENALNGHIDPRGENHEKK